MKLLYHPAVLLHDTGACPEHASRLSGFQDLPPVSEIPDGGDFIGLVHDAAYIRQVRESAILERPLDADTRLSKNSFLAATAAVGLSILASRQHDFALTRPPGHHAFRDAGRGFCLFNHAAILARLAANDGKKVLVFDMDGHVGDGTMACFYGSSQVLFWSIHQYPAYPGNGAHFETGTGAGCGYTLCQPLPPGSGDDIMEHAFRAYLPIALEFNPDQVVVSAGFDAHVDEPLLQLRATSRSFYEIGRTLGLHFRGKMCAVLEGGYHAAYLPRGVAAFLSGVNGVPWTEPVLPTTSTPRVWHTYLTHLNGGAQLLAKYWSLDSEFTAPPSPRIIDAP